MVMVATSFSANAILLPYCQCRKSEAVSSSTVFSSKNLYSNSFSSTCRLQQKARKNRSALTICEVALKVEGGQCSNEAGSKKQAVAGSKIRVKGPLKVYHVAKFPDLDLDGIEGVVKEVICEWKGKVVSANLPYKVQFSLPLGEKQVKFFAHLKENEFEVIE